MDSYKGLAEQELTPKYARHPLTLKFTFIADYLWIRVLGLGSLFVYLGYKFVYYYLICLKRECSFLAVFYSFGRFSQTLGSSGQNFTQTRSANSSQQANQISIHHKELFQLFNIPSRIGIKFVNLAKVLQNHYLLYHSLTSFSLIFLVDTNSLSLFTQKLQAGIIFLLDLLRILMIFLNDLKISNFQFLFHVWNAHRGRINKKHNTDGYLFSISIDLGIVLQHFQLLSFWFYFQLCQCIIQGHCIRMIRADFT